MALVRWEPAREFSTLQGEMNRLFNSFFEGGNGDRRGARRWTPAVDLMESDEHLVLKADLPGLSRDDVKIEVRDNVLTISGERRDEKEEKHGGYYRVERAFGTFSRSLTLPDGVDVDAIEADFDSGVLEVRIPKPEARQPRRIAVGRDAHETVEGTATDK